MSVVENNTKIAHVIKLLKRCDDLKERGNKQREIFNESYIGLLAFDYESKEKNWGVFIDIFKYWVTISFGLLTSTILFKSLEPHFFIILILSLVLLVVLVLLIIIRNRSMKKLEKQIKDALGDKFKWDKEEIDNLSSEIGRLNRQMEQSAKILRDETEVLMSDNK